MKTGLFLSILCSLTVTGIAQNINVTFSGTGTSAQIDSIRATNLTTNQSVTLPGNETLVLSPGNGIPSDLDTYEKDLVFPNPFSGQTIFSTHVNQAQIISLVIHNLAGQEIADYHGFIAPGPQQFAIQLKTPGIFSIAFTSDQGINSRKMICMAEVNQENSIEYLGSVSSQHNNPSVAYLKSFQSSYFLGYSAGNTIQYRCYSDDNITIRTDSPSGSVNYQIEFVECVDEDGKSYPVVKIADQTWMAENLAYLPKVDPSSDGSDNSPFLYVYGYQGNDVGSAKQDENYETYGVLYNWPAALMACPSDWHVPSDQEWDWLTNLSDASAKSGFGSLPGGIRESGGNFGSVGKATSYWTSNDIDWSGARARNLDFENVLSSRQVKNKNSGFSVRCVKNHNNAATVPTVNTYPITGITSFSADGIGHLISNHAESASDKGICWSTSPNPTLSDNKAGIGTGFGVYTVTLTGLTANTTYYYRAYATNTAGTGYGTELNFSTLDGGTFTDTRDLKTYNFVKIGNQSWMAENLAYLPAVSQPAAISGINPHCYVYGYDGTIVSTAKATANYPTYGVLYNWTSALTACPAGWHLPDKAEFSALINFMGGDAIAGYKMKSTQGWNDNVGKNGNGDNLYGFTALPGGDLEGAGVFLNLGDYGSFWTSDPDGGSNGWMWLLDNFNIGAFLHSYPKSIGVSVRCIKN